MWTMPSDNDLGNIIYNATSALHEAGSPSYALAIRNARILQGIAICNRVRQQVIPAPGWGRPPGTEPASVSRDANPAILAECCRAAQAAKRIAGGLVRRAPVTAGGVGVSIGIALPPNPFFSPALLFGASLYLHDWNPPPLRWTILHGGVDPNTHLVATWGPFQDVAACMLHARTRTINPHATGRIPACRGYIGVYVSFTYLGRAFASLELGCQPHEVGAGRERARHTEQVRNMNWTSLLRRNPPL